MITTGNALLWHKNKSASHNIFDVLCFVLVVTVFFTNLIHLKHLGSKFQLTELVFLLIIPFIPYRKLIAHHFKHNRTFIYIVLTYLLFDFTSSWLSHRTSSLLESTGRLYLLGLFIIWAYQFSQYTIPHLIAKLTKVILISSALLILIAVLGYAQAFIMGWSPYILIARDYPYFGSIYRLKGPTYTPAMLISGLTFIIVYLMGSGKSKSTNIILALLFICALLTLSKSLVLLSLCLFIFFLKAMGWLNKPWLVIATIGFTIVWFFFTHFLLINKHSSQVESLKSTTFTSDKIFYENDNYVVLETGYFTLKRVAVQIAGDHPLFGVGTGNFNNAIRDLKSQGLFPGKFPDFDPHSTYLGILAENGVFPFALWLTMLGFVLKQFIARPDLLSNNFMLALFLILLTFIIEGAATDIFNFRHLWLFFALALTYLQQSKPAIDSK